MRNAWHKAKQRICERSFVDDDVARWTVGETTTTALVISLHVECSALDCEEIYAETQLELRRRPFIQRALQAGWTYNKTGNWLCPDCPMETMTGQWLNHLIVHERIDKWREGDDPQTTTDDQALYAYVEQGELVHTIFIEWDEEDSKWIIEGESVGTIVIARTSSGIPISALDRTVDYASDIWGALAAAMRRSREYQLRLADQQQLKEEEQNHA